MAEPTAPPPAGIMERMKALEEAAQPVIMSSNVQIDIDVGIDQRRQEMDSSWKTQFDKVAVDGFEFDIDGLKDKFSAGGSAEEMMQQFLLEVSKAKAELSQGYEAKAAAARAEFDERMLAKDAELASVRQELEDKAAELAAAPTPEPEPAPAAESDPFSFDLGIGAAMASIDANIMGTLRGTNTDAAAIAELEKKTAELEEAHAEVAAARENAHSETMRADTAEAEARSLQTQLDTQQAEGMSRETAMKMQAQQWAEQQRQQVIEQAETQLQVMQQGFEEQLAAAVADAAAGAAAAVPEDPNEKRIDPSDGHAYSKVKFQGAYGGTFSSNRLLATTLKFSLEVSFAA